MAAPVERGITAPVAGGAATSPVATQVGDLVVVITWERAGAGVPTHTVDSGNNYVEIRTQGHDDGSTDGRLSVAYKIATNSGANSYQAYTTSTGSPTWWTGIVVYQVGTFNVGSLPPSAGTTGTTNAVPNPPSVAGLTAAIDYRVLAIAAWHLGSSLTNTVTAPSGYSLRWDIAGAALADLALATVAASGVTSVDPGTFGDNQAPNGTSSITIAIPGIQATRGQVSFVEFETPFSATRGRFSFTELEVPNAAAATRGQLGFAEFETPLVATRGQVGFVEFEVPLVATRGQLAFVEFETPLLPTRGQFSFTELETPDDTPPEPTRGRVGFLELETPFQATRGLVGFVEFEVPLVPTRGRLGFVEFEAPIRGTRGQLSFAEMEAGLSPARGRVSYVEFQVPDVGGVTIVRRLVLTFSREMIQRR